MEQLTVTDGKLSLWNAQQTRALIASLWGFLLTPPEHAAALTAKAVGVGYDMAVRERRHGHRLGAPHLHTSRAYFVTLARTSTDMTVRPLALHIKYMSKENSAVLIPFSRRSAAREDTSGLKKFKFSFLTISLVV